MALMVGVGTFLVFWALVMIATAIDDLARSIGDVADAIAGIEGVLERHK